MSSLMLPFNFLNFKHFLGSYVTHGLDEAIQNFKEGRQNANKALISITDGYNHPSVTVNQIRQRTEELVHNGVKLHAIGRTELIRYCIFHTLAFFFSNWTFRYEQCDFPSAPRTEVCRRRAESMTLLNENDDAVYR